jgi:F-type H+-transporting ATPase subunit b
MKRAWMLAAAVGLMVTLGTVAWAALENAHHDASTWSGLAPLAWNIGNFAILVYILYRFGGEKISAYLRERKKNIRSNLELAEKARDEACEKARIYREKLEAVEEEIQRIIAELKEEGEAEKNRIIESARQSVEQIKKEARRAAEEELNRSAALLREEMVSLSTLMAEEILHRNLTPEDQHRLIRHYLDQMAELP